LSEQEMKPNTERVNEVGAKLDVPMTTLIGFEKVQVALGQRQEWWMKILWALDAHSQVREDFSWARYDFFGPVMNLCPTALEPFGKGDEEKYICDLQSLIKVTDGPCVIFSVGSRGDWGWEREIHAMTDCTVHTFDCTGDFPAPSDLAPRVKSYKLCIGKKERGPDFMPYGDLLKHAGITRPPTYFKMDVEGFEWNVFPDMLLAGIMLPEQIGFEIHHSKLMPQLGWVQEGGKNEAEIAIFGDIWYRSGYLIFHRRDNAYGVAGEATEYLMVKVTNPI